MTDEIQAPSPMPTPVISTNRLEAFSDGVFAIVITLLVLELRLPPVPGGGPGPLAPRLLAMAPQFVAYAIAFVIVGMTWIGHHGLFHLISRTDKTLMWLNLLILICVSFVPFPSMVLGLYPMHPVAIRLFAGTMLLASLSYNLAWWYAMKECRLIRRDLDPEVCRQQTLRGLQFIGIYALALAGSFLHPIAGLVMLAIMPLSFIFPSRFDPRHFKAVRP
ncbi:MAG TPA: TMEM175 family protein [Holophagaceae bacterium]|nr:TMEM175 family protein [Holophagaceae bacterium]